MSLREVKSEIMEGADSRVEEILSEAGKKAEEIVEEAERKAEEIEKENRERIEKMAEQVVERRKSEARLKVKKDKASAKGEVLQEVREEFGKEVSGISDERELKLVKKAVKNVSEKVEISELTVSEQLVDSLEDEFGDLEVVGDSIRGVKIKESDRDVVHNLTFEKLVDEVFENNKYQVSRKVFEG